jgi:hypothetical protein
MNRRVIARWTFAATALAVGAGLAIQIPLVWNATEGHFTTPLGRVFNLFCYFTVQSNVIVGITCLLLTLRPDRDSTVFAVFRLAGVIDIAITGVVYHVALAQLFELKGYAFVADQLLHTVVPVLAVGGWLVFGPRRRVSWPIVGWAMVVPIGWTIFTLVRGPIVHYYPYPFIDVDLHGYGIVFVNMALVAGLFFALAAGALALDRVLAKGSDTSTLRS